MNEQAKSFVDMKAQVGNITLYATNKRPEVEIKMAHLSAEPIKLNNTQLRRLIMFLQAIEEMIHEEW